MACNDHETYEYISDKTLGMKTVKRKKWHIPFLWTVSSFEKPVMTPDQVRRFLEAKKGSAIVMRNGKRSMFVKIAKSYQVLPVWLINPSKDHGETRARAWFRSVWEDWSSRRNEQVKLVDTSTPRLLPSDESKLDALLLSTRPSSPKT